MSPKANPRQMTANQASLFQLFTVLNAFPDRLDADADQMMDATVSRTQTFMRSGRYSDPKNAPSTVARKKSSTPLVETQFYVQNIRKQRINGITFVGPDARKDVMPGPHRKRRVRLVTLALLLEYGSGGLRVNKTTGEVTEYTRLTRSRTLLERDGTSEARIPARPFWERVNKVNGPMNHNYMTNRATASWVAIKSAAGKGAR